MIRQRQAAVLALMALVLLTRPLLAQPADSLIAVSADIVEISGSIDTELGVTWAPFQTGINFAERAIPTGIFKIGDFARQTALQSSLTMLITEGKAQTLANPKVIVQSGSQADFMVGEKIPYPVINNQGVGVDLKDIVTKLEVKPVINPNKKDAIVAAVMVTNETPDYSHTVTVGNGTVPSVITRVINSTVELKSGETLVIGGLKSSSKNISVTRIPFISSIPIIGWLFTRKSDVEAQDSLYLFITMEIVK